MKAKEVITWLIIFVIGSLIINFILNPDSFSSFKKRFYTSINEIKENSIKDTNKIIECPKGIIPEKIKILLNESRNSPKGYGRYNIFEIKTEKWEDGVALEVNRIDSAGFDLYGIEPDCKKGSVEGENVNYFYCNRLEYNPPTQIINAGGFIEKVDNESYSINVVINQIDDEEWTEEEIVDTKPSVVIESKTFRNYSVISSTCIKK